MANDCISYLRFNADYSTLFVGTVDKFKLVDLQSEHFTEEFEDCKGVYLIERYLQSRLLFLVKHDERKKLYLYNIQTRQKFTNLRFDCCIVAVRTTHKRLVVCLENSIEIYDIPKIEKIHVLEDVPSNPQGIIALCSTEGKSYLAYPGSTVEGIVNIFDINSMNMITQISAHKGLLSALSFNSLGSLFATASEKGTVIRVFSTDENATRLMELRRGLVRSACIHSLTFSEDGEFLVTCSNTETVHVFRLDMNGIHSDNQCHESVNEVNEVIDTQGEGDVNCSPDNQESWLQWMYSTLCASTYYLPTQVTDILRPSRAVIVARLPSSSSNIYKIAAIIKHNNLPRLVVASANGSLDLFAVDPINGGEAHHIKNINVLENEDVSPEVRSGDLIGDLIRVERDSLPSLSSVETPYSVLEGVGNLRLQDPSEFPYLSNNSRKEHRKKR